MQAGAPAEGPVAAPSAADSGSVGHAWRVLDGVTASINQADTKAGVVLAAAGVLGGVLFNLVGGGRGPGAWAVSATVVAAVLVLAAAGCAGAALYPRRRGEGAASSLIYFDHIVRSGATADGLAQPLAGLLADPAALTAQIAGQVWANARIAGTKFDWVDRAVRLLLAAFVAVGGAAVAAALKV
ncbi:Pycsar system effector family protein [Kitasatospora sp. NPDC093679]|uniref:Pycsar system effector family protein n=1 Tax=Kitasatospora sp. NPDC093679 TaxID=3154983 RepID=UPI003424BD26